MSKFVQVVSVSVLLLLLLLGTPVSTAAPASVRIWPLGDSITLGCCTGTPVESGYRAQLYSRLTSAGYTVDFVGSLHDENPPAGLADADHDGHGGYRIDEIDAGIERWLGEIDDPDVILLLIGTNDFGQNHDTAHAIDRLNNLITHLAALRPFAKIIVANLLLRTDFPNVETAIENTFNPFVPGVVNSQVSLGRQVTFVDMHSCCGPADLAEGLHPSVAGYGKIGDAWFSAVTSVIAPTGTADPPALARVKAQVDLTHVVITFSKPIDDSASNLANYSLNGGLTVTQAVLDASKRVVTLTTTPQAPSSSYSLAITGIRDRTPQQNPIAPGTRVTFRSGAVPEASNYSLVYSLKLPNQADFNASGDVPYSLDNHLSIGSFSRVAYYLELQPNAGSFQYLWVSMNAFTPDVTKIGVPTIQSGAFFQQTVANMNVRSSLPGIVTGDGLSGGNLEFWWGNYGPNNDANIPGASGALYDWGDSASATDGAGYGSMQVHNSAAGQTLFAFNNWGNETEIVDLGIGNYSGQHPDWTFAQNGTNYLYKNLQVYVLPGASSSTPVITKQPGHLTAQAGGSASLQVFAVGQAPLSYQWRYNGTPISGATSSTYPIGTVQSGHGGTYTVVVSNSGGAVTSSPAILTVVSSGILANGSFESDYAAWTATGNQGIGAEAPFQPSDGLKTVVFNWGQTAPNGVVSQSFTTVVGQPYSLAFDAGVLAYNSNEQRLRVTVKGNATLVLQTISLLGPGNGTVLWVPQSQIFVADSSVTTLTFQDVSPTTTSADLMLDRVRVNLHNAPVIATQPVNVMVLAGRSASFTVAANGSGPFSYQWRFNGNPISGANGITYSIPIVQSAHAGNYSVVVSNASGSAVSSSASLTVIQTGGLVNGSFESDYTGWTASGNQGIASGAPYQASAGSKAVAFNWGQSTPNGVLSQPFATTPGQTYTLAFDQGAFGYNSNEQRLQVTVDGSGAVLSSTASVFGPGNGTLRWSSQSFSFVANSEISILTFRDISPTTASLDMVLDNVRVTAPNVPSVWTLTINSVDPASGISIRLGPADENGAGNGVSSFTRRYTDGTVVTLGAPVKIGSNSFQKWQRDGIDYANTIGTTVRMDSNHTLTAVFAPVPIFTLTVTSTLSGVTVRVGPADKLGAGNGIPRFGRLYTEGTVVSLAAPFRIGSNTFQKWQKDGVDLSTSTSITVRMDANHTLNLVY